MSKNEKSRSFGSIRFVLLVYDAVLANGLLTRLTSVADAFYTSGQALGCPPGTSAHISAHNAVRLGEASLVERVRSQAHAAQQARLEANFKKAQKRAQAKGRSIPPRDDYYHHWGYSYFMYAPWVYPIYWTPGMYYCDPMYAGGHAGGCKCGLISPFLLPCRFRSRSAR